MTSPTSKPHVRVPWRCWLGRHAMVDLPKPKNRMMRLFVVRRVQACARCGVVHTTRFTNAVAGGGTSVVGYLPPAEVEERRTAGEEVCRARTG